MPTPVKIQSLPATPTLSEDRRGMALALEQAQLAWQANEVPVGAVVIHQQTVIGSGFNQLIQQQSALKHAEVIALESAMAWCQNHRLSHLSNATLYVTLEPCLMCTGLILHSRIARVVFGAYDTQQCGLSLINNDLSISYKKPLIIGGVRHTECQQLLNAFFHHRRSRSIRLPSL